MSLHEIYNTYTEGGDDLGDALFADREKIIRAITRKTRFDVAIIGGGIHGAAFARLAAFNNLRTVLLERDDYAEATSSRSSKMAHGGLRYLELFDLQQVREGIRCREDLFNCAPHLVRPHPFFIPIQRGEWFARLKLGIGLSFYDRLVKEPSRKHRWVDAAQAASEIPDLDTNGLAGGYIYYDGVLSDARLVMENILSARQEGAFCLNHAHVKSFGQKKDGSVSVGWTDGLTGKDHSLQAGIVINCAGPWVAEAGRLRPSELANRMVLSRGTHLVFSKKWNAPALFLKVPGKARYQFVWPHADGTMVGTTERLVEGPISDPLPSPDEVNELLKCMQEKLPAAGLTRESLRYCFAGIRTLAAKDRIAPGETPRLSRKHIWDYSGGVLSLIGGKLTTAAWTAMEGLQRVFQIAYLKQSPVSLEGQVFPGAIAYEEKVEMFRGKARAAGVPETLIENAIRRLGGRVALICERGFSLGVIGNVIIRGEIELALDGEQAETLSDIVHRRLLIFDLADKTVLRKILEIMSERRPGLDIEGQLTSFCEAQARSHLLIQ